MTRYGTADTRLRVSADHILIPLHDFSFGGTENIAFRLASHWIAAGRKVTILAGADRGPMRDRVPEGVEVEVLSPECPRSTFSRLHLGRRMAPVVKRLQPDAAFIPGNYHFPIARSLKTAKPDLKIVAKISNPLVPLSLTTGLRRRTAAAVLHTMTRGIDCFAATSPGLADDMRGLISAAQLELLYNPFAADEALTRLGERRTLGDPLRLIGIGRLERQKDWPLALAAIHELRRDTAVRLTIYGEGPQRARIEETIVAMGLRDVVELAGHTRDLAAAFRGAHALVVTSHFEGGPAVAAEALAHGVPVIATDCSHFLRDLIDDPALGQIVAQRDPTALAHALRNAGTRAFARPQLVEEKLAPVRAGAASAAYLRVFDKLVADATNHR